MLNVTTKLHKETIVLFEQALDKQDFKQMQVLSKTLYCDNQSNCKLIVVFGKMIEQAAFNKDFLTADSLIASLKLYLLNIKNLNNTIPQVTSLSAKAGAGII